MVKILYDIGERDMKNKIKYLVIVQLLVISSIMFMGCKKNSDESSNIAENTATEVKTTEKSTEDSIVDIGKVKSVIYSGYSNYYFVDTNEKSYQIDTTGKIIKEESIANSCPTTIFEGIQMKQRIDTAKNKGYYVICDNNGNDITSKYVSSSDRFFKIYNVNGEPLIAAIVFNENPTASEGVVVFKDRYADEIYAIGTDDDAFKLNNIDVKYLKNTDTNLSYVGDGMAYLSNKYHGSYFINLETKEVFEDKFKGHGDYIDGYLSYNNGRCGIIDKHGNNILDTTVAPKLQCLYSQGLYYNCTDNKFYDINGNCKIDLSNYDVENPYKYTGSYDGKVKKYVFDEAGLCKIIVNNPSGKKYYGLIDTEGKWVIELQPEEFSYFKQVGDNLILLQKGGYYVVYNIVNKEYVGASIEISQQDTPKNFHDGVLVYLDDGKLNIYDYNIEENKELILHR